MIYKQNTRKTGTVGKFPIKIRLMFWIVKKDLMKFQDFGDKIKSYKSLTFFPDGSCCRAHGYEGECLLSC